MLIHKYFRVSVLLLFFVIIALFFITSPVLADDGGVTPTGEAAPTEVATPDPLQTAPPEVVDTTEPVVTETTVPVETSGEVVLTDPAPVEETATAAPESEVLPEVLATLAEADIALVDSSGEAITPLSRDSSSLIADGDPWFDVGSVRYRFMVDCTGFSNCTEATWPIQAAIDYLAAHNLTPTDRKIHIEADVYYDDLDVDGSLPGVRGLTGIVGHGDTPEDVAINGHVEIYNFPTGFSLTNLSVLNTYYTHDYAIYTHNNSGTITMTDVNARVTGHDSSGIIIDQTGNVVLNRVNASDNAYMGADITASGTITITNSAFDDNLHNVVDGDTFVGLNITDTASGAVTLNGISAQTNIGDGVDIFAPNSTVTIKNAVLNDNDKDSLVASWGDGLWLFGNIVNLENIVANNNDMRGIYTEANSSVSGTRLFADTNGWNGVRVLTCLGYTVFESWCHNTGPGMVTIKNSAATNNGYTNFYSGFEIDAKGAVTLYDIYSGNNQGRGILIANQAAPTPAAVNLTLVTSNDNLQGFTIYTRGAVAGKNVVADYNDDKGLVINSTGTAPITFTIDTANPLVFNETAHNGASGFDIVSLGPISLTSFDSYQNTGGYGGYIDNSDATSAMPITVTVANPASTINGYTENATTGLFVYSRGAISLSYISASNNQEAGAFINNYSWLPAGAPGVPVTISNSNFNTNCAQDEFGCFWTGIMDEYGLDVQSKGAITLLNVNANGNYGDGATLTNNYTGAAAPVTINAVAGKSNSFSYNGLTGLEVNSRGAITTTNLDADVNGLYGAVLTNNGAGVTAGVVLNAGTGMANYFESNGNSGLTILSNGAVTITNIASNYNLDGDGVDINNTGGVGAVTIKQIPTLNFPGNIFNGNEVKGLHIQSRGAVTVAFYQSKDNLLDTNVDIIANGGTGAVSLTGTTSYFENLSNESIYGLHILAKGNITVTNVYSSGHMLYDAYGAMLDNSTGTGSVTITNGYFNDNLTGLIVHTTGVVTWKIGSANDNFLKGADIDNVPGVLVAGKAVAITDVSTNGNGETGLEVNSKGVVTLTNVESNNNSADGYWLEMDDRWIDNMSDGQEWLFNAPGSGEVTIEVYSPNFTPTILVYDAYDNYVASISGASGDASLNIDGLTPDELYFIYLLTDTWNGNSYSIAIFEGEVDPGVYDDYLSNANGIYVDNSAGTYAASVSYTNPAFHPWTSNNSGSNVYILTNGAVTVSNVDLNDSTQYGLDVNNAGSSSTPAITITDVYFINNDATGAWIRSKGAVTIKNSESDGNRGSLWGWGYDIDNTFGTALSPVSLTNVKAYDNGDDGIFVRSDGAVTLNTTISSNNGLSGYDIAAGGAVTFTGVKAFGNDRYGIHVATPGAFTFNRPTISANWIGGNDYSGLYVEAGGKVTLTGVYSNSNAIFGIHVAISNPLGTSAVVMTDIRTNDNTATGTYVVTSGAVTITMLEALNNDVFGLYVDQLAAPNSLYAMTLTKITATGNAFDGIYVEGKGNIVLSKFNASFNDGAGVNLLNTEGAGNVTISNPAGGATNNLAIYNGGVGVNIESDGAVSVTGLESAYNTLDGLIIKNNTAGLPKTVTLNSLNIRENGQAGVFVQSLGVVTITSAWSVSNGHDGFVVLSHANTLMYYSGATNNGWTGMYIDLTNPPLTPGNLTLTGCFWYGNLREDPYPFPGDTNLMFFGGTRTIL
jgi:hypothetical protein